MQCWQSGFCDSSDYIDTILVLLENMVYTLKHQ